jgi:hypothetical protein
MQPFIRTLSRKQPSGSRRNAKQHEKLASIAVSHNIDRPLDRFLRGSTRCHPQFLNDSIQHRVTQHREFDVLWQQNR